MEKTSIKAIILSVAIVSCVILNLHSEKEIILSNDTLKETESEVIYIEQQKKKLEVPVFNELQIMSVESESPTIKIEDEFVIKEKEMKSELKKISEIEDKKKWFKKYKKIQKKYSEYFDPDETIYDVFSEDELDLLFRIVESEVTGDSNFECKANVASVIFNRMESDDFPNNIIDVLKQKVGRYGQFSSYWDGRYKTVEVTDTTILACEYAFQIEDATNGCLYFDSCNGDSWNNRNLELVFRDEVGHDFFR